MVDSELVGSCDFGGGEAKRVSEADVELLEGLLEHVKTAIAATVGPHVHGQRVLGHH